MSGRVVIADDETVIRLGVRTILEEAGYTVVGEASAGGQVLGLVEELNPDVVVLDIKMPDINGIEVARRLHHQHPVPVVFLTAFGDQELIRLAKEAGGFAYVVKPIQGAEIVAAVELARARWQDLQSLRETLETRKLVERAKGILMRKLGIGEEDAYRLLHRFSRSQRKPLRKVAEAVIAKEG
ncbi:MAG: response regulator [Armatimonadota bacterium]|nr:response regulator [Armatimonadota bacterium]MDR5702166.1 response regulator [Armatimonadota bacterium]MDR7433946.1 response regulator [Armatimonadota bacterium]